MVIYEYEEHNVVAIKVGSKPTTLMRYPVQSNTSHLGHAYFQISQTKTTNLFFKRGRVALTSHGDTPYNLLAKRICKGVLGRP